LKENTTRQKDRKTERQRERRKRERERERGADIQKMRREKKPIDR